MWKGSPISHIDCGYQKAKNYNCTWHLGLGIVSGLSRLEIGNVQYVGYKSPFNRTNICSPKSRNPSLDSLAQQIPN